MHIRIRNPGCNHTHTEKKKNLKNHELSICMWVMNLNGHLLSLKVEELHVLCCESGSGQTRNFWQDPDPEQIITGMPDSGISGSEMNLKQNYSEKLIK